MASLILEHLNPHRLNVEREQALNNLLQEIKALFETYALPNPISVIGDAHGGFKTNIYGLQNQQTSTVTYFGYAEGKGSSLNIIPNPSSYQGMTPVTGIKYDALNKKWVAEEPEADLHTVIVKQLLKSAKFT